MQGAKEAVVLALHIMCDAVDRYKELCEGQYSGELAWLLCVLTCETHCETHREILCRFAVYYSVAVLLTILPVQATLCAAQVGCTGSVAHSKLCETDSFACLLMPNSVFPERHTESGICCVQASMCLGHSSFMI